MIWLARVVILLVLVAAVAAGVFFGASQHAIHRTVDIALPQIRAMTDTVDLAEGERLAHIAGCTVCHGDNGQGSVEFYEPGIARIVAPALWRVAWQATDQQLARAIRNGVSIHAQPIFLMPTRALNRLSDDDVARLVGWIRTLQPSPEDMLVPKEFGLEGRLDLITDKFNDHVVTNGGQPKHRPAAIGRYLVEISCEQCHAVGRDETMQEGGHVAPALARAVAAYDPDALKALLRTGKARDGRDLPIMTAYARLGLYALSDNEIDAIQGYLKSRRTHGARP